MVVETMLGPVDIYIHGDLEESGGEVGPGGEGTYLIQNANRAGTNDDEGNAKALHILKFGTV